MRIAVHSHINARKLCEVEISDAEKARLDQPPPLADAFRAEDHVVEIGSGADALRLFPATVNGVEVIMTNTPDAALARAIA
jgi:hypothetical protein